MLTLCCCSPILILTFPPPPTSQGNVSMAAVWAPCIYLCYTLSVALISIIVMVESILINCNSISYMQNPGKTKTPILSALLCGNIRKLSNLATALASIPMVDSGNGMEE